MVDELTNLIEDFPGPANQTRCFLHILNLVVKSIIQQFDIPISKKITDGEEDDESMDEATKEFLKLAGEIDLEEEITVSTSDEGDPMEDDNEEGWVDEHEEMTEEELLKLVKSIQPVRFF